MALPFSGELLSCQAASNKARSPSIIFTRRTQSSKTQPESALGITLQCPRP